MEGEARGGRSEVGEENRVSGGLLFGLTCSLQGEGLGAGAPGLGSREGEETRVLGRAERAQV